MFIYMSDNPRQFDNFKFDMSYFSPSKQGSEKDEESPSVLSAAVSPAASRVSNPLTSSPAYSGVSVASLDSAPSPIRMSSNSLNRGGTSDFLGELFGDDDMELFGDDDMELDEEQERYGAGGITGGKVKSDLEPKKMIPIPLKIDGIWSASPEEAEKAREAYMEAASSAVTSSSNRKAKAKAKSKPKAKSRRGGRKRKTRRKKKSKRKKRRKSRRRKTKKKK